MATLKRRIEEMERLQRCRSKLRCNIPGAVVTPGGVILILPDPGPPDPTPEERTAVEPPARGEGPILILPDGPQSVIEDEDGNA